MEGKSRGKPSDVAAYVHFRHYNEASQRTGPARLP